VFDFLKSVVFYHPLAHHLFSVRRNHLNTSVSRTVHTTCFGLTGHHQVLKILILKGNCWPSAVFIIICLSVFRPCVGTHVLDVTPPLSCCVSVTAFTN
jgi:hypothetical protein